MLPIVSPSDREARSLGSRKSVLASLSHLNTHAECDGGDILYGPGVEFQLAPNQDPIVQMILVLSDEDIAWQVIERIGKTLKWKYVDVNSGEEMVFSSR